LNGFFKTTQENKNGHDIEGINCVDVDCIELGQRWGRENTLLKLWAIKGREFLD
jgi:hypothetical protein